MLCTNKIDNKIKTIVYLQQHYYGSDQVLIKSDISNHCLRLIDRDHRLAVIIGGDRVSSLLPAISTDSE